MDIDKGMPAEEKAAVTEEKAEVKSYRTYDPKNIASKRKNRTLKNFLIFAGIILVLIICGVLLMEKDLKYSTGNSYPHDDFIARINVEGVIDGSNSADYFGNPIGYQHQWTLDTLDELMYEESNKGLIIFVNSPGGGVYESDELYFKIKEYKEVTGRPVYSVMGSVAASGGYYISAPCDRIIADRNTFTGSIGVTMGTMFDFSELLKNYGVKTNTITSGDNKAMGSSVNPMTAEQKAIFQSIVDEAYEQFSEIVAEGRKMKIERVKEIADGRIYTARQAKKLKLIDDIGNYEYALNDMKERYKLQGCRAVDIREEGSSFLGSIFGSVDIQGLVPKSDLAIIKEMTDSQIKAPISYICTSLAK